MDDMISRQQAIDAVLNNEHSTDITLMGDAFGKGYTEGYKEEQNNVLQYLADLPSAQPEQRYTEEELRVFKHGISLSLLSKRSSQYWQYDEDTATEIKFLERLYEKVDADMRGEQDDSV